MYKRGNSWYSEFTWQGVRHKKSWGQISKTVAQEKEDKWKIRIREGLPMHRIRRIRFEKFAKQYLDWAKLNKKPNTVRRNKYSLEVLKRTFHGKLIGSITAQMAENYKRLRIESGKKPATVNRDIDVLRNMMKMAVEWGYLTINHLAGVKHLKEDNERMWVLTDEQEEKLLTECDKRPQRKGAKYLKDLVEFALYTGMRQDEIFGLKKMHVHLKENFVLATDTKTGENRNVPLNDRAAAVLKRRLKAFGSQWVFCTDRATRITQLTKAYWYAVKKVGLIRYDGDEKIRFRFHDLRHSFGSRLGMAGTDLKTIMEVMGHKTHKMAMRYQHPAPEHKLAAVKILDRLHPEVTPDKIIPFTSSRK